MRILRVLVAFVLATTIGFANSQINSWEIKMVDAQIEKEAQIIELYKMFFEAGSSQIDGIPAEGNDISAFLINKAKADGLISSAIDTEDFLLNHWEQRMSVRISNDMLEIKSVIPSDVARAYYQTKVANGVGFSEANDVVGYRYILNGDVMQFKAFSAAIEHEPCPDGFICSNSLTPPAFVAAGQEVRVLNYKTGTYTAYRLHEADNSVKAHRVVYIGDRSGDFLVTGNTLTTKVADAEDRLNTRVDEEVETLNTRVDTEVETLNTRVDTEVQTLDTRITQERAEVNLERQNLDTRLTDEIDAERQRLNAILDGAGKVKSDGIADGAVVSSKIGAGQVRKENIDPDGIELKLSALRTESGDSVLSEEIGKLSPAIVPFNFTQGTPYWRATDSFRMSQSTTKAICDVTLEAGKNGAAGGAGRSGGGGAGRASKAFMGTPGSHNGEISSSRTKLVVIAKDGYFGLSLGGGGGGGGGSGAGSGRSGGGGGGGGGAGNGGNGGAGGGGVHGAGGAGGGGGAGNGGNGYGRTWGYGSLGGYGGNGGNGGYGGGNGGNGGNGGYSGGGAGGAGGNGYVSCIY